MHLPDWLDYWPAIIRARYWAACLRAVVAAAATVSLVSVAALFIGFLWDWAQGHSNSEGIGGWLGTLDHTQKAMLWGKLWIVGLVLYAGLRVWQARLEVFVNAPYGPIASKGGATRTGNKGERSFTFVVVVPQVEFINQRPGAAASLDVSLVFSDGWEVYGIADLDQYKEKVRVDIPANTRLPPMGLKWEVFRKGTREQDQEATIAAAPTFKLKIVDALSNTKPLIIDLPGNGEM